VDGIAKSWWIGDETACFAGLRDGHDVCETVSFMGFKGILGAAIAASTLGTGCIFMTSCFVRGTRVRTPSGTKAIESLAVGDEVIAFDEKTMALTVRRITALHSAKVARVRTVVVAGRRVVTTDEHPFWEAERRAWTRAGDLTIGNVLAVLEEGRLVPKTIETIVDEQRNSDVFNITVDGEHTYLAEDIAVHNKDTACSVEVCGAPVTPSSPMPTPPTFTETGNGEISVANETGQPLDVRVVAMLDGAMLDGEMLRGDRPFTIPDDSFPAKTGPWGTFVIGPNEARRFPTGALTVVDIDGDNTTRRAVVLEVEGKRVLVVGTGRVSAKKDGFGALVATGEAQVVPIDKKTGTSCVGARDPLELPTVTSIDVDQTFIVDPTTIANGCDKISLHRPDSVATTITLGLCGPSSVWPFNTNDAVVVEAPKLLTNMKGVRFVRKSDGKAVEVGRVLERSGLFMQPSERVLGMSTSGCALPPKEGCAALTIRTNLVDQGTRNPVLPDTKLALANGSGSVYVLGGKRSLFAFDCNEDFGFTFDVVAHSP